MNQTPAIRDSFGNVFFLHHTSDVLLTALSFSLLPTVYSLLSVHYSELWCFTTRASATKITSSAMFVARSATRSRFLLTRMISKA